MSSLFFRQSLLLFFIGIVGIQALDTKNPSFLVLPPPQSIQVNMNHEQSISTTVWLHPSTFNITLHPNTYQRLEKYPFVMTRLTRMIERYTKYMINRYVNDHDITVISSTNTVSKNCQLMNLEIDISTSQYILNENTDYSYTLGISETNCPTAIITAKTIYGAQYGMESFSQLLQLSDLSTISSTPIFTFPYSSIMIDDAPQYAWRGLMIDSGRRFFPVPLVENLLDTMSANKMSVLHLHASDMCRFGVESLKYKNLTDALVGIMSGYYSQTDISNLISYAGDRGIRIVPEFDIPGHSRGFIPLINEGIQFCEPSDPTKSQLYGDPQNQTLNILTDLFSEMTSLFTDDVFHIGCDETSALGPCT